MSEAPDECASNIRATVRPDADGHADLDFAWPHCVDLPLHDDAGADRERWPQTIQWPRQFRDHGNPVLHSRWYVPYARWGRQAYDQFYNLAGWTLAGRARTCGRYCLRAVRRHLWLERRNSCGDRLDHPARDGSAGLSKTVRSRRRHDLRCAGYPGSAVNHPGALRRFDQYLDWHAVHGRYRAGRHSCFDVGHGRLGYCWAGEL